MEKGVYPVMAQAERVWRGWGGVLGSPTSMVKHMQVDAMAGSFRN
ncbi:MAG: hypothetical protein AAFY20_21635 [Cyanobacteria bacterium J06639_14]